VTYPLGCMFFGFSASAGNAAQKQQNAKRGRREGAKAFHREIRGVCASTLVLRKRAWKDISAARIRSLHCSLRRISCRTSSSLASSALCPVRRCRAFQDCRSHTHESRQRPHVILALGNATSRIANRHPLIPGEPPVQFHTIAMHIRGHVAATGIAPSSTHARLPSVPRVASCKQILVQHFPL